MGMGFPWEWELVTKLGMGKNGNRLHGNGREWECKKPFPAISTTELENKTTMKTKETKIAIYKDRGLETKCLITSYQYIAR